VVRSDGGAGRQARQNAYSRAAAAARPVVGRIVAMAGVLDGRDGDAVAAAIIAADGWTGL